ncbi:OmpA family protein [Nocardioides sp.]|uniref:OmpA family protein n=1 Tax=Nocardioides sp. TaxID=35761 RepID=UPI002630A8C2|nr:OmpA family protein [Nocardioides sp.]
MTPSRTPVRPARRLLGAILSVGLAVGAVLTGGALVASPASAVVPDLCSVSFSPTAIHPGESTTVTITTTTTAENGYLPAILTANGQILSGHTVSLNGHSQTQDYSWWSSFGDLSPTPTSVGYRIYDQYTDNRTVTESTPSVCSGEVTLLPAAANQTVTLAPQADRLVSAGPFGLTATATSGLAVAFTSTTTSVCTVTSTGTVTPVSAGWCQIKADQAGNDDYDAAPSAYLDFYLQVPQTITFAPITTQVLGTGPLTLDVSADSARFVTVTSNTPQVCSVTENLPRAARLFQKTVAYDPSTVTLLAVGTCSLTATRAASSQWAAATPVTRTFAITDGTTPELTFHAPSGAPLSAGTVAATATSSVGGTVAVTSLTPAVCAVQGSLTRLLTAGTCRLRATQTGAAAVTTSFPVWPTPVLPRRGKATAVIPVLGAGESDLTVSATPRATCQVNGGTVLLLAAGSCKVTVSRGPRVVRTGTIAISFPKASTPAAQLEHAGTAYFAFDSSRLTKRAKKTLRSVVPTLKEASLVVVYGNTYGPGKNSKHSRKLSAARAQAVVDYLATQGVKAKSVKVAAAMQNPVSAKAAKNRRADIYMVKPTVSA